MQGRRVCRWSGLFVVLFVGLLAGPAWSGHGRNESTLIYSHGCGGRKAETEASLRELVRLLTGQGAMAVGDRLRCAVQAHPKLATRLLIPLVATSNHEASLMAAKMLGEIGPDASAAVPRLIKMLHSRNKDSRVMAAQALSHMGPAAASAVPALIGLLDDEETSVRQHAAGALAHLGPAAGAAAIPLGWLVGDPNARVRSSASYAMQELGYAVRDAVPTLVKLLDHDDADVRKRAATAIGHIGPFAESARGRLEALANDPAEDAAVRKGARGALHALSLRAAVTKHGEQGGVLLPLVVARLDSDDPTEWLEALSLIGFLGAAASEAAPRVAEMTDDPDPALRLAAVHALGFIGANDAASVPAIGRRLDDSDLQTRRAAEARGRRARRRS
jgi:HEAT repeat protein